MKILVSSFLACSILFFASSVPAQTSPNPVVRSFTIGPLLTFGLAIFSGTAPDGRQEKLRLGYNLGLQAQLRSTNEMGYTLGLAYDDRAMKFQNTDDASKSTITDFHYITLLPGGYWKDLTFGLGIGIPLGAAVDENLSPYLTDAPKTAVNILFELRVGAAIPMTDIDGNVLSFLMNATYPLTKAMNVMDYQTADGTKTNAGSGSVATLRAGLSYQFGF